MSNTITRRKFKVNACPLCLGTGAVQDPKVLGAKHRAFREAHGVALSSAARAMGVTPGCLCFLEKGRRGWTPAKIQAYEAAVLRAAADPAAYEFAAWLTREQEIFSK